MATISAPVFTYRSEITDSAVRKEFEQLYASLRTSLHNVIELVGQIPPGAGDGDEEPPPPGGGMDLDYLGDYRPGIYNDGDIVIGADGVAYMCVVDGTATPPEPWPGVGIAQVISDAQYWISTAHPSLPVARDIGALASGYVKSTMSAGVSTPSTVAVIPLSDGGTGATNASDARTNLGLGSMAVQNANSVAITGGTIAGTHYGDGSNLTNLNASQLTHGTVAPARMGGGTPSSGTYLRGDGVWAAIPAAEVFPSGLIVLSVSPCPPGWTRVVWDGNFLRVGPTPGAQGGSWDHTHGVGSLSVASHNHDRGTYKTDGHSHGGSVNGGTNSTGGHSHGFSVSGTTGADNGQGPQYFQVGSGGGINRSNPSHDHNFSASGNTDGVGDHSHSFDVGFTTWEASPNINGVSGDAAPAVVGSTAAAGHLPPFIDIYLCQKN